MIFDRLLLIAAALLFSTGGAAIKASSLTSWQIAGFRSGIAALVLLLCFPGARRGWTWRVLRTGVAYAATLVLFVAANKLTTSANAIFLQSTAPMYLLLLGPIVLHEPIQGVHLIATSAVALGVVLLLFGSEQAVATAPDPMRGNLFAALGGAAWALTITGLRRIGKDALTSDAAIVPVIVGNMVAFMACLPAAVPVVHASTADVLVVLYLGIFQVGLAYVAMTRGLRRVPGLEASILLMIEPVFNPIWSWLVHGERPSGLALAGGMVIVLSTFGATWWRHRKKNVLAADERG
jgi:drug/metabolite transporter, DME family